MEINTWCNCGVEWKAQYVSPTYKGSTREEAIAALEAAEVQKPSHNSRYATALDVVQQYVKEVANSESSKFVDWLYQRLNPAERDSA